MMQPIKFFFATLLCLGFCFTQCQKDKKVNTEYFFYLDHAYFQHKQSQLLSCLENKDLKDTLACVRTYLVDGPAAPTQMFIDTLLPGKGGHEGTELKCCPCQHKPVCVIPCDGTGSCTQCQCPSRLISQINDGMAGTLMLFKIDDKGNPGAPIPIEIKKQRRDLAGQDFFEFTFPPDFTATVILSYRGAILGLATFNQGELQGLDPNMPHPCK